MSKIYTRKLTTFVLLFTLLFVATKTKSLAAQDYIPGTSCPEPPSNNMVSICGIIRHAMPEVMNKIKREAKPVAGVSVYAYEFDPTSTTGKDNGDFTHAFSSTYTTMNDDDGYNGGRFYLPMRARGGKSIRFLVFACSGKIAGIREIPSYRSIPDIVEYIDCYDNQAYAEPPAKLQYVDRNGNLTCEMQQSDSQNNPLTMGLKPSVPVKTTMNFDLELTGADIRFAPKGNTIQEPWRSILPSSAIGGLGPLSYLHDWEDGSWWSRDCKLQLSKNKDFQNPATAMALCAEDLVTYSNGGTTVDVQPYVNALYGLPIWPSRNKRYVAANFLPNIPPKRQILFYKDFTAQQDMTEYIQTPSAVAQFLHTHFGNCIGKVFLRKSSEKTTEDYVNCDEFKQCNSMLSVGGDVNNTLTTGGYAKNMMMPFKLEENNYVDSIDPDTIVCKLNGNNTTIGQIMGDENLKKQYYNPEMLLYYGQRGSTTKLYNRIESTNDSFNSGAHRDATIKPKKEGYIANRGGTSPVYLNGGKNTNNSVASAIALTTDGAVANNNVALTNVNEMPFKPDLNRYISGIKISDKGELNKVYCLYSLTNKQDGPATVNVTNEQTVNEDNYFKGNHSHYQPDTTNPTTAMAMESRTPTSAQFMTSVAMVRQDTLRDHIDWLFNDAFDSALTASSGDREYAFDIAKGIGAYLLTLFKTGVNGTQTYKNFLDRVDSNGTPSATDDLKVKFELAESNFLQTFKLPTKQFNPHGTDCNPAAASVTSTSGWCEDTQCYPHHEIPYKGNTTWHYGGSGPVIDNYGPERCDTYGEPVNVNGHTYQISRTCRVDECEWVSYGKSRSCIPNATYTGCVNNGGVNTSGPTQQGDCSEEQRAKAAELQLTTAYLDNSGAGSLKMNTGYFEYLAAQLDDPECDGNVVQFDPHTGYYCDSASTGGGNPAAIVSRAGPYICKGDVLKDATFVTLQTDINNIAASTAPPEPVLITDNITLAENAAFKQWRMPYRIDRTLVKGAEESANSSVNMDSTYQMGPRDGAKTKGKEVDKGIGGGGKGEIMAHFSIPSEFLVDNIVDYPEPSYHCQSTSPEISGPGTRYPWTCQVPKVPADIDIASLNDSCKLNPSASCLSALGVTELSPTFLKIVGAAASKFDMDPAAILAYMGALNGDGSKFRMYAYLWSISGEQQLIDASSPWYGRMPMCNDTNTSAEGPFDYITIWFNGDLKAGAAAALNELSPGRGDPDPEVVGGYYASKCNFLDATYARAASLSDGGSIHLGCGSNWSRALASHLLTSFYGFDDGGDGGGFTRDGDNDCTNLLNPESGTTTACGVLARAKAVYAACR